LERNVLPNVLAFLQAVENGDSQLIANMIRFPLRRKSPLPSIENKQEFLSYYDTLFDKAFQDQLQQYGKEEDYGSVGWRGVMVGRGDVWFEYGTGNIMAINYHSQKGQLAQEALLDRLKSSLHPSIQEFRELGVRCTTETHTVRVDRMQNGSRYASWSRNKKQSDSPDLVLTGKDFHYDGSAGSGYYSFQNTNVEYLLIYARICSASTQCGWRLVINESGKMIYEGVCHEVSAMGQKAADADPGYGSLYS
jgi:hypothetical protein